MPAHGICQLSWVWSNVSRYKGMPCPNWLPARIQLLARDHSRGGTVQLDGCLDLVPQDTKAPLIVPVDQPGVFQGMDVVINVLVVPADIRRELADILGGLPPQALQ